MGTRAISSQRSLEGLFTKFNAAGDPLLSFESKENIQFTEVMHITYAIVGLYKDRSYRGLKDLISRNPPDLWYVYERVVLSKELPPSGSIMSQRN